MFPIDTDGYGKDRKAPFIIPLIGLLDMPILMASWLLAVLDRHLLAWATLVVYVAEDIIPDGTSRND